MRKSRSGFGIGLLLLMTTYAAEAFAPSFSSNVLVKANAFQDEPYNLTLANNASDPENDTLTFSKLSGPTWLNVVADGNVTGTPGVANLGLNSFSVQVEDPDGSNDTATLEIMVNGPFPAISPYAGTNVLFIAIDDLRASLGCYNDPVAISPNIDSLASGGTVFLNNHCQWAVCGPSRASLMTSLMPEETGVEGFKNMRHILPDVITIPHLFRANGYETAATGKLNDPRCVGNPDPANPGDKTLNGRNIDDVASWSIPYVPSPSGYSTNLSNAGPDLPDTDFVDGGIAQQGLTLMNSLATGDKPFFLAVGFKKPHVPWYAPKTYWDYYERSDFQVATFTNKPLNGSDSAWKDGTEVHQYPDIPQIYPEPIPEEKQLELIHSYYACVSFIDAQVGLLLDELETLGLHTNTIVVLWSDHGYHLGDHSQWGKHTYMENGTRAPFVIRSPFMTNAVPSTATPTGFLDIFPTLCGMIGLPVPEQPLSNVQLTGRPLRGVNLVPLMEGSVSAVRDGIINYKRSGYAFRTKRYRYIEWVSGGVVTARDLYDYEQDPLETVNLAVEPEYAALMYQYSRAMRNNPESPGCYKLLAAAELPIPGDRSMVGLKIAPAESNGMLRVSWPGVGGQLYHLVSTTNLIDATWTTNQADVIGEEIDVVPDEPHLFYGVEVTE